MFNITNKQYIIIICLIILIISYCIFIYPYIFNKIDIIHYKMKIQKMKEYTEYDKKDIELKEYINNVINYIFSNICNLINYILKKNKDIQNNIYNIIYDFIIYI